MRSIVYHNTFVLSNLEWRERFFFLQYYSDIAIWQTILRIAIRLPWTWTSLITLKMKSGRHLDTATGDHWWTQILTLIREICQVRRGSSYVSKIGVLKNVAILWWKQLCRSLFLLKLHAWRPETFWKRDSNIVAFLWILGNVYKQLFYRTRPVVAFFFFFLIGIHSMQGWTATTRHGVTTKKAQKKITGYRKSV